ncbi:serine hydrolase domain-containing protein [Luteimonas saliphila]|uniref:serine hydrolase domain-containing protein n=1 Tax=Luteimonas saliphila TaxID=2804919 RepID=UPI00192DC56E|nr:serine hydrolase [Luteimonas saliphila]
MRHRLQAMLLAVFLSACGGVDSSPAVVEGEGPPACVPVAGETFDTAAVEMLFDDLSRDLTGDLRGVVVTRHGCIAAERYFNGDGPRTLRDIRSATKSITSTLVGIAIRQGLLTGLDQSIADILPPGMPAEQRRIRIGDLLTMRSGLDADDDDPGSKGNEDRLDASPEWIPFAYAVPMKYAPGERYVYSSLDAFLAGSVVEHASGMSLQRFAQEHLFGPLGISDVSWRRGPQGEGVGQGNLGISARDMTKLGNLFLNDGRVGQHQIVDPKWVREAISPVVDISMLDPYADSYGYMWYTKRYERGGRSIVVHFASGNGGNKIYLVPRYGLVVAITSTAYGQGYGQRRSERILLQLLDATDAPD